LRFYQAVEQELASVPGVRTFSFGGNLPLDGWDIGQGFRIVGDPSPDLAHGPSAHYQITGAHYFDVLGIPMLEGRAFTGRDIATAPPVCIVNEEFVRRYLNGREPIGMKVSVQAMDPKGPTAIVREIVGVSRQVKVEGPGEKQNAVEIYVPITQNPWYSASLAVRTAGSPLSFLPAVKAAIARVDKDQPVTRVRTMEEVAAESIAQPRFRAELVGAFAALALVLAAVGVFGVLAFAVQQRTREFGIRLALGARRADLVRLVLGGGLRITAAGVAIGLVTSGALARFVGSLLFGVQPLDPIALLTAAALLLCTALAACAAPALRAATVDPAVALRNE
jgi:putative ABC transport system permease protein